MEKYKLTREEAKKAKELEKFCLLLENRDAKISANAEKALTEMVRNATVMPALISALGSVDYFYGKPSIDRSEREPIMRKVAGILRDTNSEVASSALTETLKDESYSRIHARRSAATVLSYMGSKYAMQVLAEKLESSCINSRCELTDSELLNLIWALGNVGGKSAVQNLLKILQEPVWAAVGVTALMLSSIGDKSAVPALTRIIENKAHAFGGLHYFCLTYTDDMCLIPRSIYPTSEGGWGFWDRSKFRIVKYSGIGVAWMMETVDWQGCIAKALGSLGDKSTIPLLTRVVTEKEKHKWLGTLPKYSPYGRFSAIDAMGSIGDKSALSTLIAATKDNLWDARWSAVRALGRIKDESAIPALTEALKDRKMRRNAAIALSRIRQKFEN